jgi:uncharacterized membrane protein (DUF373 family)
MDRVIRIIERGVLYAAQALLALVIIAALYQLWFLFVVTIGDHLRDLRTLPLLTEAVQRAFSGVLLVILGLELLETLRVYVTHHRVRLEIILVVAIIAVGRHVINLDYHQVDGVAIAAIAALVIALTGGYYLVSKVGEPADASRGVSDR